MIAFVLLIVGFILLVKGADVLIAGASSLARKIGISELAIGLTIVSFGTSAPELAVNVSGALSGSTDIAIGNVVGSNIANILLILAVAAIIRPMDIQRSTAWKEIPFGILAAVVLLTMTNDTLLDGYSLSELSRSDGVTLIAFFLIYLWYTFGMQRVEGDGNDNGPEKGIIVSLLFIVGGLIALVAGGQMTVSSATTIARSFGLSEAMIGLTVVAVGTSLPELVTSAVAAYKNKADIAIGNIVGSNIFNTFLVLGVTSTIRPLPFGPELNADLFVAAGAMLVLFFLIHNGGIHKRIILWWTQKKGHQLQRIDGIAMLAGYIAYMTLVIWRG